MTLLLNLESLDSKLRHEHLLESVFRRVNKANGLLKRLQLTLPRKSAVTICKSFIRPRLDYGVMVYDQAFYESIRQNLKSFQYSATISTTETIRGTSSEKFFKNWAWKPSKQEDG